MNISNYQIKTSTIYNKTRQPIGINLIIDNINKYKKDNNIHTDNINILDCGCGTGNYTEILINNGYNVTSIDYNDNMLKILKEKNLKNNIIKKVNIKEILPFNDNQFDIIIINQVLHHLNDFNDNFIYHKSLIKEISRIIKNNGLFTINTSSLENHIYGYWWTVFALEETMEYTKKYCPHNIFYDILKTNNFKYDYLISKEPLIDNYFDKNTYLNENIRQTDTLWKYINDDKYEYICSCIKNMNETFFNDRLKLLEIYGQTTFYICICNK